MAGRAVALSRQRAHAPGRLRVDRDEPNRVGRRLAAQARDHCDAQTCCNQGQLGRVLRSRVEMRGRAPLLLSVRISQSWQVWPVVQLIQSSRASSSTATLVR